MMGAWKEKRPTLKTISELCGLAVPTVSRALHDAPDISEKTKLRVKEVARRVGYVPDGAGLRLRTGKTQVVALVMETSQAVQDQMSVVISNIATVLSEKHYSLIVTPQIPGQNPLVALRKIVEGKLADCVILNRTEPEDPRVEYLMLRKFPFVTHGRTVWESRHAYLDYDNTRFAHMCVDRLIAAGRSQLALLAPRPNHFFARELIEGSAERAKACNIPIEIVENVTSDDEPDCVQREMSEYLRQRPDLDGLICPSMTSAYSALCAIERSGRKVGEDIDICSKDIDPFYSIHRPEILTFPEDVVATGQFLAEAAIHAVKSPDAPPMQRILYS